MVTLKTRRKIREWLSSRLAVGVLVVLFLLLVSPVWSMYRNYTESRELRSEAEREMEEITAQSERIEDEIRYLQSELGREDELRQRFTAGREGERVAIIFDDGSGSVVEVGPDEGRTLWQSIGAVLRFPFFWLE